MLSEAKLHPIILTSRLEEAETFYRDTLGLPLVGHSDGALVFRVGDGDLRIGPVESVAPSGHTALAFSVPDLDSTVAKLVASGEAGRQRTTDRRGGDDNAVGRLRAKLD
jgi:catechol 2,3-dioxygenase-like lactoylglutathione lyase family enzyme